MSHRVEYTLDYLDNFKNTMPQLSTGRKVAIQLNGVAEIIHNPFQHLEELGQIEFPEQMYRFIPIIVFIQADNGDEGMIELNPDSTKTHELEGMRAVEQPYSVADVLSGQADWSMEEVEEFKLWFDEKGGAKICVEIMEIIERINPNIKDLVDAMAYTDIDPMQDDEERFRRAGRFIRALTGQALNAKRPN